MGLRDKYHHASTVNVPEPATWVEKTSRFYYRKSVKGGHEFVMVDANTLKRKPAFDHTRLAAALSKEIGDKCTALGCRSASSRSWTESAIELIAGGSRPAATFRIGTTRASRIGPPAASSAARASAGPFATARPRRRQAEALARREVGAFVKNFNIAVRRRRGEEQRTGNGALSARTVGAIIHASIFD